MSNAPRFFFVPIFLMLASCEPSETTSGLYYIETANSLLAESSNATLSPELVKAAGAEPILRAPAKIGIARLAEPGDEDEFESWRQALKGQRLGRIVPISTVVIDMNNVARENMDRLSAIRLAAARQHMEAMLVYRLNTRAEWSDSALSFFDLTIVGGMLLPTRHHRAESVGEAILMDVRNGYLYGIASGHGQQNGHSNSWGERSYSKSLADAAESQALADLQSDVLAMFERLELELAALDRPKVASPK